MKKKRQSETSNEVVSDWRRQAQEMLPELMDEISDAVTPMQLWIEIGFAFDNAYNEPRNEDLIRRIYSFASWCVKQPQIVDAQAQDDLFTCVVVCFYEDIPANKAARADMPRWFTKEEVQQNKEVFSYSISEGDYQELLNLFALTKIDKGRKRSKSVAPCRE